MLPDRNFAVNKLQLCRYSAALCRNDEYPTCAEQNITRAVFLRGYILSLQDDILTTRRFEPLSAVKSPQRRGSRDGERDI